MQFCSRAKARLVKNRPPWLLQWGTSSRSPLFSSQASVWVLCSFSLQHCTSTTWENYRREGHGEEPLFFLIRARLLGRLQNLLVFSCDFRNTGNLPYLLARSPRSLRFDWGSILDFGLCAFQVCRSPHPSRFPLSQLKNQRVGLSH